MSARAEAPLPRPITRALFSLALLAALAWPVGAPDDADASSRLDRTERQVIHLINGNRRAVGLPRLRANRALARSASAHSGDMLRRNFFAHSSSNGTSFAERVRGYKRAGRIGENLGFVRHGAGSQARRIVSMWLDSPGHRAVILSRAYTRIGVARRAGGLGSMHVVVFTADFSSAR